MSAERWRQVHELLAAGLKHAEIARRLGISPPRVYGLAARQHPPRELQSADERHRRVADLLHAGRTITEIAFELRITRHYVRQIVRQMEPESEERKLSASERRSQVLALLEAGRTPTEIAIELDITRTYVRQIVRGIRCEQEIAPPANHPVISRLDSALAGRAEEICRLEEENRQLRAKIDRVVGRFRAVDERIRHELDHLRVLADELFAEGPPSKSEAQTPAEQPMEPEVESLEANDSAPDIVLPPKRPGRKSMGAAERAEVSERMKRYWLYRKQTASPA
jgi:DNA-binding NarL/FixJ family response regulator